MSHQKSEEVSKTSRRDGHTSDDRESAATSGLSLVPISLPLEPVFSRRRMLNVAGALANSLVVFYATNKLFGRHQKLVQALESSFFVRTARELFERLIARAPKRLDTFDCALLSLAALILCRRLFRLYTYLTGPKLADRFMGSAVKFLSRFVPAVRKEVEKKNREAVADMEKSLVQPTEQSFVELPPQGMKSEEVMRLIDSRTAGETAWKGGKVSGAVYHCEESLMKVAADVNAKYLLSNPLHPDLFPSLRQMEAEVVAMVVSLFNGDSDCCGSVTSGGTESILLAMKSYREWGRVVKGIEKPEVIASVCVHAAFDKAADYFGMKLIKVAIDPVTSEIDLKQVRAALSCNTVALVGSCPHFPHGTIDPIEELAEIARRHQLGLHVDACLGSFLVSTMDAAGFPLPPFDFRVPGVTSISCDPHKYGFAPKGTSVLMFRDAGLRTFQFFTCPEWTGGIYASPTIAGSRPGALVASTWAVMLSMGYKGYVNSCKTIVACARRIAERISAGDVPGIRLVGRPDVSVVAFTSDALPIYAISEAMSKKFHWHLNSLQSPNAVHLCVTLAVAQKSEMAFIENLRESVALVAANPREWVTGGAAIYGMAQGVPQELVSDLIGQYFTVLYTPFVAGEKEKEGAEALEGRAREAK
uniref:sphinganine-1-phosphate aldolase n=1 Tax=Chromera velia CCMP2878 TaxID=1169474 RepID=A0A0G4HB11_9ALVE|eukprot:Cvel_25877.t1-p1 / transcript=Cvel_25877.t1 / gene=Cvel_25877 / organism=Chromera_velia_CCMP2878 / gene_product=Sphingosine-1-phosphate lyase 1, putative / transcript_product=Sphingosine-1-phosphate lyase 1, putative / location=Cvel_scaffold2987:14812-20428(-) / protein_length=644 / sequence_SO=supercontig / SO=protein_coding / is_pseudo=false